MKNKPLLMLSALLALAVTGQVSAQNWSAKSIEKHLGNTSGAVIKSSEPSTNALVPLAMTAQVKNSPTQKNSLSPAAQKAITLTARPQALHNEFWIYDAQVTLYSDLDFDGYYHHFAVEFDGDTVFAHAEVYARLYLARREVFEEYHTSSVFHINGESTEDSFVVESELLTGFPSGDYEVLIELYDALNDELVATLDGNNDADLYALPLESESFEDVYVEPSVVVIHESGGSMAYLSLLLLPFALFRKRQNKQIVKTG
jgi:hypothetical protein